MTENELAREFLEIIPVAMRAIRTEMRALAKSELTVPQFRVMARIGRDVATPTELAQWMGVTSPTMSRMLLTLSKRGYIKRFTVRGDRRLVQLKLTSKGEEMTSRLRLIVRDKFAKRLADLSPQSRTALAGGLNALKEIL